MLPTLYIRDSKGKDRQWNVRTVGDCIIVSHGLVSGKKTDKFTKAKPKNIGKVNETTAEQQALLEAQAKWTYQIEREDYNEDIEQAGKQIRPMLALDYLKVPHRVRWESAIAQPKLDGLRLTSGLRYTDRRTDAFEMLTRKGETYHLPHMIEPCVELLKIVNSLCGGKCLALDGEAYIHGMPLQSIVSLARRYQPGETEKLEYHLFDLVIPDMAFEDRYSLLCESVCTYELDGVDNLFNVVPCQPIKKCEIAALQGEYMEMGYEGVMIRHAFSKYSIAQRSPDLFKFKLFYYDEFKCVGMHLDKDGNAMLEMEGYAGKKLDCKDTILINDIKFDCTPKLTHDIRSKMMDEPEKWLGWWTVKYQDLTEDQLPTFNVGITPRDCDDDGNPII